MAAQSTICLLLCIFAIFYFVESKSSRSRQRQNDSSNCKNLEWGPCQNLTKLNGICGHGLKKGRGVGVGCENLERQCKVPCPECRYNRGNFGDCDKISAKRSRVDTLDESNSDTRCQKERTIEKPCRKNKKKCKSSRCHAKELAAAAETIDDSATLASPSPSNRRSLKNLAKYDAKCQKSQNGTETCIGGGRRGRKRGTAAATRRSKKL